MSTQIRAIVSDFDYTLVDSSRGVIECIAYAQERLGLPPATDEAICRTIGLSLADTLVALWGAQYADLAAEFARLFAERADQVMVDLTTIYPETPRVLRALRQKGIALAIVSNKFRYRIEWTLARAGLAGAVDAIVGGEDVTRLKPDPQGLLLALERLGAGREDSLYVGDSVADAGAAERAGVRFVFVATGATRLEDLQDYHKYAALADIGGLLDLV